MTHVVFQGGHVSIYKKAKQQMLPVVAVSWIEASKELGCKAPEEEHPPPGFEKYEDPHAARKIKVSIFIMILFPSIFKLYSL